MLPLIGTISYNDYTFPGSTRSNIQATPLYDPADRVVVAVKYVVTLTFVVHNSTNVSADMLDLEQRLTKPGQDFFYESNGSSGLSVNTGQNSNNAKDSMWGPKPRLLVLRQIGGKQAYEVSWRCEVTIPRCDNAAFEKQIMAFTFDAQISIDSDGYSTRTITGELEIPMTRKPGGGSTVPDSVDNYWEKCVPGLLPGFQRVTRDRTISSDRRTLHFTIVDRQIPGGGFPAGVTNASGRHSISTAMPNIYQYTSNLTATYVVPPGVSKSKASDAFYTLLMDRSDQSKGAGKGRIFTGFSVSEGLYSDREITFTASWTYFSTLAECMIDGGMFRTLSTDWNEWVKSDGVSKALSARASADLKIQAGDDQLIGLCEDGTAILKKQKGVTESKLKLKITTPTATNQITADRSWLKAQFWIKTQVESSIVRHKPLARSKSEAVITNIGQMNVLDSISSIKTTSSGIFSGSLPTIADADNDGSNAITSGVGGVISDVIQKRAASTWIVTLTGFVMRAQYRIPVPQLVTVGGKTATPNRQRISEAVVAVWSGVPINGAKFEMEYWFTEQPNGVKIQIPGNPALFTPVQE